MREWLWNAAWSVVGFFAGMYFQYWFAVRQEKRKEFNEIADRLSVVLDEQRRKTFRGSWDPRRSYEDLVLIRRMIWCFKRSEFERAETEYREATDDIISDVMASPNYYKDPDRVQRAIEKLAMLLERR